MLNRIWKDRIISTRLKLRLFESNVKSTLLYGCATWSLTQTIQKKLQTFVNTCLRKILKIFWPERISNEELWSKTGQSPIGEEIARRKWRWLGHTLRKPKHSISRHALQWNPQGQRVRGRPRTTWRRNLENDMERFGYTWRELIKLAQDRREWKTVVRGLYPVQDERQ